MLWQVHSAGSWSTRNCSIRPDSALIEGYLVSRQQLGKA